MWIECDLRECIVQVGVQRGMDHVRHSLFDLVIDTSLHSYKLQSERVLTSRYTEY